MSAQGNCFEELIGRLRIEGHNVTANKLDCLLHETAWTTGSELMGELGLEILAFQRSAVGVSAELQRSLNDCMSAVRKVWPGVK